MSTQTLTPQTGLVRIRVQSPVGRWLNVGPFLTLSGARRLAEDLLAEYPRTVNAVRVEHRQRGAGWKPCWSFTQHQGG